MPDWFRNKLELKHDDYEVLRAVSSYNPERFFGSFIPDDGPFQNEQEKTDWRMANWGTIHEASEVILDFSEGDEYIVIIFTTYQTIPYQFIDYLKSDAKSFHIIRHDGFSIVGEYGDLDETIIFYGHWFESSLYNLRMDIYENGWSYFDSLRETITFIEEENEQLANALDLPHRDYEPETSSQENSDSSDSNSSNDDSKEDQSERTKAIRKKHRDLLSLTFKKLVEAPDTEYICLICHADKSEEVPDSAKVLMTACGHLFHRSCIKKWVRDAREPTNKHNLCPACRTDIIAFHGPESKLNSQETDAVETPKE